jgi:hypothetical protein
MCWTAIQLFDEETEEFIEGIDKRVPLYKAKGIDDSVLWDYSTNKEFKVITKCEKCRSFLRSN